MVNINKDLLTCRRVLYLMGITAFMINGGLVNIFSITIVAMVKPNNGSSSENTFDWTESQKQNIFGVFIWGYAISKLPSGRLSEIVGPRKVIGYSTLVAALLTILTPLMSKWNYYVLLCSRVVIGFLLGTTFPSFPPLTVKWIPPTARSKFLSCMEGSSLGIVFISLLSGFLIPVWDWPGVFYTVGTIVLLWTIMWFLLIYDSPELHPRISVEEKKEILEQLKTNVSPTSLKVPWKKIFTSVPIWAIIVAQVAYHFTYLTLANELPSYMDQVLQFQIKEIGLISSIPYVTTYISCIIFGYVADYLIKLDKFSVITVRKMFESLGLLSQTIFMSFLSVYGDRVVASITLFILTITVNTACLCGHYVNILDIAPNFSGTIAGIAFGISSISGFFSTQIVTLLLQHGHTFFQWRNLFWILCVINFTGWAIYVIFGSSKLQSWNSIISEERTNQDVTE